MKAELGFLLIATGLICFFSGVFWVRAEQNLEISRLNSELQKRDEEIKNAAKNVEIHKNLIRKKDTVARRFCDEFFKGDKK